MKHLFTIISLALIPFAAMPQKTIFEYEDSVRIEEILHRIASENISTTGERLISIANEFIGEKYVAGTLEQGAGEPLFISCTKLDCTTFVELVLAIAKTSHDGDAKFSDVCHNLETIRYRNGINSGYSSRLHYISWWIRDPAKKGIIEEITPLISNEKQLLNINFMSTHPDSYPLLADNNELIKEIEQLEIPYRGIEVNYIPKEEVHDSGCENIRSGDIVAITTSIPGLDVTHIGFAYYHNGTLGLLHASSGKGEVMKETRTLRDYLAGKKSHTGIRVFRSKF